MNREDFFTYCFETYKTAPDYPFNDFNETAAFRHAETGKWYALVMTISKSKLGIHSEEITTVVNLKLPAEMFGSFTAADGVYPAYHMNKAHWISVDLGVATDDTIKFLTDTSYRATKTNPKPQNPNVYLIY